MADAYISIPRDLTRVKDKLLFGLTKRQLLCFTVAALIGVPVFFMLKSITEVNIAIMGMMIVMMPIFFFAMYEKNGRPVEVYLGHFIEAVFIRPKVRPYKTDNYYAALARQADAERKVERVVRNSMEEKERRKKVPNA